MALSSRQKNKLVDNINVAFDSVGSSNGTRMPKCESNLAPVAYEYWLAQHLASRANKRKEQAEKRAIDAGVLFDKDKHPREPGTRETIYACEIVSVNVEVRNPATRVDVSALLKFLAEKGVNQKLLDVALEQAQTRNKPAHVFTSALVVANGAE